MVSPPARCPSRMPPPSDVCTSSRGPVPIDGKRELTTAKPSLLVQVSGDTFAPRTTEVRVPRGETLDLGPIRVERGIEVGGVVRDPQAGPVAGAEVELELNPVMQRRATTDESGRFRVPTLAADAER